MGSSLHEQGGKPGRLLESLTMQKNSEKPGIRDQILFFDEFDRILTSDDPASKSLLSMILKILDPAQRSFYSPYLGMDVALPKIIVLAGNFDLREFHADRLEALISRLRIIKFEGYSADNKKSIVWKQIVPSMLKNFAKNRNPRYQLNKIEDEDKKAINRFIEKDTDPGMRSVDKFIHSTLEKRVRLRLKLGQQG